MKKIGLVLLLITSLFIAACSSSSGSSESNGNDSQQDGNDESYTMRIGHTLNPESPRHQVLEMFKEQVEEKTDNNIKIEIYPSNQVGDNNQLLQAVPLGNVEGAIQPTAFFGGVQNKLSVVDFPFIWEDMNHIGEVLGGETGEKILSTLEEKGIKGLAFWPIGMKVISSNEPIDSVDAFSGQKFRTMGTPVLLDVFSNWGTNPTAIAIPELYSSLQQGVIEGQENDIGTMHDLKLYEVQEHMLPLYHGAVIDVFYVNKEWFDNLPESYQNAIQETATSLISEKIQLELDTVDEKLNVITNSDNITVTEPTEELINEFRERSESIKLEFIEEYPDMEEVLAEIEG